MVKQDVVVSVCTEQEMVNWVNSTNCSQPNELLERVQLNNRYMAYVIGTSKAKGTVIANTKEFEVKGGHLVVLYDMFTNIGTTAGHCLHVWDCHIRNSADTQKRQLNIMEI